MNNLIEIQNSKFEFRFNWRQTYNAAHLGVLWQANSWQILHAGLASAGKKLPV
jgi:hypothetical protein